MAQPGFIHILKSVNQKEHIFMSERNFAYQFFVKDAKEIDIDRICKEAPEGTEVILVTARNGFGILALATEFLNKFNNIKGVNVTDFSLSQSWGATSVRFTNDQDYFGSITRTSQGSNDGPFRFREIYASDIPKIKKDLAFARHCLTCDRTVTVRYL